MLDVLASRWWVMMFYGVLTTLFGLVSIFAPQETVMTVFMYLGMFLILSGVLFLYRGNVAYREGYPSNLLFLEGAVNLVFGFFILFFPEGTARFIFFWVGVWILIFGIIQISKAFQIKKLYGNWQNLMITGGIASLLGLLIIFRPIKFAMAFTFLFGFGFLIIGIFLMITAWQYKKLY
jgi:uncharacterized membrane protein HdeD (DUF308 family)